MYESSYDSSKFMSKNQQKTHNIGSFSVDNSDKSALKLRFNDLKIS
jgi:hypothetical protein